MTSETPRGADIRRSPMRGHLAGAVLASHASAAVFGAAVGLTADGAGRVPIVLVALAGTAASALMLIGALRRARPVCRECATPSGGAPS